MMAEPYELGPIRPPSEAFSLLIRVTRNCPWNRCHFCPTYRGQKFQLRTVDEVKEDIRKAGVIQDEIKALARRSGDGNNLKLAAARLVNSAPNDAYRNVALWMAAGGRSAFLQDANTLIGPTGDLVEILRYLKETFPGIERITSYGRSHTAARKSPADLAALHEAGLTRLHLGLETGYDPLLKYMDKGVTAAEHIAGGRKVVASGISLSEYVILGLGGRRWWREHATETARVLNEINPSFIRVRTLSVTERMPLHEDVAGGIFLRETDEEIVEEEKVFIEHLECGASFISDHVTNLLQEIEGKLPGDKEKMLAVIRRFQSLAPEGRLNFRVGRRLGVYQNLDDIDNVPRHQHVAEVIQRLEQSGSGDTEEAIHTLMERFI